MHPTAIELMKVKLTLRSHAALEIQSGSFHLFWVFGHLLMVAIHYRNGR